MSMRGWHAHEQALRRLQDSYAAIPSEKSVRLAKKSSNLFRPRAAGGVGLDVSGLVGVIEIDQSARTAQVQGMCTYEDLVAATLPLGLMPLVVPQLRTITLGGAVTGLGIEATSFRNGLPHESVLELEILTGGGEVVLARPDNENKDLFEAFPNSYGSLGYATRLQILLEAVAPYVSLRHVAFDRAADLQAAIVRVCETGSFDDTRVDAMDGVAFQPGEYYLSLAEFTPNATARPSDYTRQQIYYRSIQQRARDVLTIEDYLWRWDTDWFWCSRAFGAQHPVVRRLWPRRFKRSDVYHRLIGLDRRWGVADRLDRRAGQPLREMVVQDVEILVGRLDDFLNWFDAEVGIRPVWLCPVVSRGTPSGQPWPSYPMPVGTVHVNVGFWGSVPVGPDAVNAPRNKAIEAKLTELGGHKSLYSEAFYDRETFDSLYGGEGIAAVKKRYDPDARLLTLYDKAVGQR